MVMRERYQKHETHQEFVASLHAPTVALESGASSRGRPSMNCRTIGSRVA